MNTALSNSSPKTTVLFDANAIIELHRCSLWKPVVHACRAAVTPIIRKETKFYKDEQGEKKTIELSNEIESQRLEEIPVSAGVFQSLERVLKDFFLEGIDDGEREAIAFLHCTKQKSLYLFCTADMLAIKCLGVLGLRYQGISIEELLQKSHVKPRASYRAAGSHSKQAFERMLSEGFQESHLHKK